MTALSQFLGTVYALVVAGRWKELTEYFALIRDLSARPTGVIIPGKPIDKEIKK